MPTDKFWIRNEWDRSIAESVLIGDEYRLRSLWEAGHKLHWVLDVGAHIGAFTRLVKQYWPEAQVIAIEPAPDAEPYFQLNTSQFNGIYYHRIALVAAGGPKSVRLMKAADGNPAASFVAEAVDSLTPIPTDRDQELVPATDIAQLLALHGSPDLDLVKLDCEGAEALILGDLRSTKYLPRIRLICGEWHYFDSIPLIEAALSETHCLELYRHEYPWGAFFAEPHANYNREAMTTSNSNPKSIQEMYPQVPVEMLVSDEWQQRFKEYFLDSGEFNADPFEVVEFTERPHKKCVSVCLFKQNVNNRSPNEFPFDENYWCSKYWKGLLGVIDEMHDFPEWKLRIYVEKDLWDKVYREFSVHPQVELYRMMVNSIGANPGSLWRFLALADPSLTVVLETDIDEPLMWKADYIRSFEMDSWSSIGRVGGFASDRQFLVDPIGSTAKNYATMIGSRVMSRPTRFEFDLSDAMRGFMAYRRYHSTSVRPWAYDVNEKPSAYNQPIGAHVYGCGSHWYMYCFDERFLKHVMYYHFADKGEIHTWALSVPPSQMDPEGRCDLQYVRSRRNTTVYPHNAVRLARLELSPDALRIAFVLDEYRWIFDALLQMMQEHAHGGTCGNLFFHEIANPYFVELVPKQLNLFKTAQHATKAMEIGFNAGHSAAIMLLANPQLTVRAFDTCWLKYSKPCAEFLNSLFGDRLTLIEGHSQVTVASDVEVGYDLVHIDADHTFEAVAADLANCLPKCVNEAIVVMDDYEASNDVARATLKRKDLVRTEAYTVRKVFPGSSHAIFRYRNRGIL
ncbi:MAG: FkbM family methyltransferase [Planctomycetia bacterium]|nr:FkbM family methyltransferase [Planctomycetia bacterium]